MFALLNDLRKLRARVGLGRPARPRSLQIRCIDAGSSNGSLHELAAAAGPWYDLARYGISITASPRHADVLLVAGTITNRMVGPIRAAYDSMPHPRIVAALGDGAIGTTTIGDPAELAGPLSSILPVDLEIPGNPPTPDQILSALVPLLDRLGPGAKLLP